MELNDSAAWIVLIDVWFAILNTDKFWLLPRSERSLVQIGCMVQRNIGSPTTQLWVLGNRYQITGS